MLSSRLAQSKPTQVPGARARLRFRAFGERVFAVASVVALAGCATIRPDLGRFGEPGHWVVRNGETNAAVEGGVRVARLAPIGGNHQGSNFALALVPDLKLSEGVIEVDLRGTGEAQKSFLGIAFGVVDQTTHEAVYFRPFNFRAADSDHHAHAVQYVAQPDFPWDRLRAEKTGVYERPLDPAPDPAGWFHVRIDVTARHVAVFVDGASQPSLSVDRLVPTRDGGVGLWVDSQPGSFANLKIQRRR
jgi:hypothetical protein